MNNKNFINLTDSFCDVYKEYREFLFSKNPHKVVINTSTPAREKISREEQKFKDINFSQVDENELKNFYKSLNIFFNLLNSVKNEILIQGFLDKNYGDLIKIKHFLIELKNIKARSLHDRIFTKIFKLDKRVPLGITIIFEEFIKGITYFRTEEENKKKIPIYHRVASCGDSSNDFKKKYLICYGTNTPQDIEIKRNHIFKCFLERLIYDNMYKHLTLHFPTNLLDSEVEQNEGHKFQLSERGINFNTCFTGIKLKIDIYYENNFPRDLIIEYLDENNNIIQIEKYYKTTFIDEYGNTNYTDNILYLKIINNIVIEQRFNHY